MLRERLLYVSLSALCCGMLLFCGQVKADDMKEKIIIYQALPRLFGNQNDTNREGGSLAENGVGKMSAFSDKVLRSLHTMGFSHVWYTGIIRHATQTGYSQFGIPQSHPAVVKGKAGSPYSISDYYDVDPDIADDIGQRMQEFEDLVHRTHDAGMKVVIDFVPNHVARQYYSIAKPRGVEDLGAADKTWKAFDPQNNFYYCPDDTFAPDIDLKAGCEQVYMEMPAKATGNDRFDAHPGKDDWYEAVKLNYGVDYCGGGAKCFNPMPDTWKKMTDILLFWASKGVDAFRCDMAEMVPVDFWHYATDTLKKQYPDIHFIGEVYNPSLYRDYVGWGGFDYLYDKVGVYDTIRAAITGATRADAITMAWQQTDDIKDHMLYFLENHDEQRIASDFFAGDAMKAVPGLVCSVLMGGNPFMMYMGQSIGERGMGKEGFSGEDGRTTIFDYWCVKSLKRLLTNKLTSEEKSLHRTYKTLLQFARKERAVAEGAFFDLMYVNPASQYFNPEKQYTFLRKHGNTLLLVCVNFDDMDSDVKVMIPEHAFDVLGMEEGEAEGKELFTSARTLFSLKKDESVSMRVGAHGAAVYKIRLKN